MLTFLKVEVYKNVNPSNSDSNYLIRRFHVVRSDKTVEYNGPDPYESTDIKLLKLEIETAELDLKKMSELRAECEILEWKCVKRPPKSCNGQEKSRKRKNVKKPADLSDTESVMSGTGVFSARKWLAKYGLVPQKLTIMDALAPTVITQQPKYVGVLKKKVHAKVRKRRCILLFKFINVYCMA